MATTKEKWQEIANRGLQDKFNPETRSKFDEAVKRGLITMPDERQTEVSTQGQRPAINQDEVGQFKNLLMRQAKGEQIDQNQLSQLESSLSQQQQDRPVRQARQPTDEEVNKLGQQESFGEALLKTPLTAVDSGASFAAGAIAEPASGIAGIFAGLNPFGETGDAAKVVKAVQGMAYSPKSQGGKDLNASIARGFQPVGEAIQGAENFAGDKTLEATGSPLLASLAKATPAAILEGLGLKGVNKTRGSRKITGITDDVAKNLENSGINIDDLSDSNVEQIKQKSKDYYSDQVERLKSFEAEGVTSTRGDITQTLDQQKSEAQLFEAAGEAGENMRATRLGQSRQIKDKISEMVDNLGVSGEAAQSVKDALTSRKKDLKIDRKELYKTLAEKTKNLEIPVVTEGIVEAISDPRKMRDIKNLYPSQSQTIDNILKDYGIIDGGQDVTPLSLENFESMRKAITAVEISEPKIGIVTGDIKRSIDESVMELSDQLVKTGNPNIAGLAKEARKSHIALMTEFDPKAMTSMLIDNKKRSNIPQVELSNVYTKLSSKSTPIEQFKRVTDSLKKSGNSGVKAMADLKNRMILDVIDTAYASGSRKINGERTFGTHAFQKKIADLQPKLNEVFNKTELKRFENMVKIAESIRPQGVAIPKGSAGFFIDVFNKLGASVMMNKIPGGALLLDKVTEMSKAAKNKKAFDNAMKKPEFKQTVELVRNDYPSLAVVLGIAQADDTEEKK